jgi:hypothetical protein
MIDRYGAIGARNLFQELIDLRDRQRKSAGVNLSLIKGARLPVETNPWGRIQWYMHPTLTDTATRTLMVWTMRIAPGSRTGRLRVQGGHVFFVWKGERGHTMLDDERHDWTTECVLNLPLRPPGITYQHFNAGPDEVVLVGACLNLFDVIGVDGGTRFEVIDPCPEWAAMQTARSAAVAEPQPA